MIKVALAAFGSVSGDEKSPADLEKFLVDEKADLERSLVASEEMLVDSKRRIEQFELNENTLNALTSMLDETEAWLKSSK